MMFAVGLVIEREPLQWVEFPLAIKMWVQNAGGVAAVAVAIWCLAYLIQRPAYASKTWSRQARFFVAMSGLAGIFYVLAILLGIGRLLGISAAEPGPVEQPAYGVAPLFSGVGDILLALGGLCAIVAATMPVVVDLCTRLRWGRIWALAKLSLKEAFRSRVVWVFSAMAVVFLFADWFVPYKEEDQVRNYVRVIYWSLAPLLLLTASLLGAFSIPTDVKNQSIHTIVTKPVERFEIVLGRFLGYGILLTGGLAVLTGISLLYVLRGVTPAAAKESFTARVPIYGDRLGFWGTNNPNEGENVGRVWGYRSYIGGPNPAAPQKPRQYAIWSYESLPWHYGPDVPVFFEFTFDIFRLTKGKEDQGVITNFVFVDGRLSVPEVEKRLADVQTERARKQSDVASQADEKRRQGMSAQAILEWQIEERNRVEAELIDKFAIYETSEEVIDYHTQTLGEAAGLQLARLFQKLNQLERAQPRQGTETMPAPPALNVFISVDRQSAAQMLGVAKRDLYLLAAEGPFWMNFIKGIVGMWFTVLLILGLAVACSTYLSGVISWLCTLFLFGAGMFTDYIRQLAQGTSPGGGPLESAYRLLKGSPGAAQLEETPAATVIRGGDEVYRLGLRGFLNIIPDVSRFDLHQYVANGFDIPWSQVLFLDNFLPLLGYLVPWAVLAYYLMKYREVANPT